MGISQRLGWIGVDIGTHTVKLAQAVRDGGIVRLYRAAVIQRPTAWSGDDELAQAQPITSCPEIRAAMECGQFAGRDAICALPMNVCQLRCLNVPPGTDQERRTMIGDELAEEWAAIRHPMEFDFWEMEASRAEKATDAFNVTVLASSRLWISQLWRDCRKCGLDCWAVDGVPLAMARAVTLAGGATGGRRALAVDWGYSNVTLCVVGDERPLYSRRVHECAFGRVVDAIMRTFDVGLDEAQHLVETQGLIVSETDSPADPGDVVGGTPEPALNGQHGTIGRSSTITSPADPRTQTAITNAAAEPLDELVRQIRRTLHFAEAQRRQQPAAVWLMGGGASMRSASAYLTSQLKLPVRIWNMPSEGEPILCAAGSRSAVFSGAVALSAAAWRAA